MTTDLAVENHRLRDMLLTNGVDPDSGRYAMESPVRDAVGKLINDLSRRAARDQIRALAYVIVDSDGDLQTDVVAIGYAVWPLLAGTIVLQDSLKAKVRQPAESKPIDPVMVS